MKTNSFMSLAAAILFFSPICTSAENTNSLVREASDAVRKKDYNRAIADFTHLIQVDPKNSSMYHDSRGLAYHREGDDTKALADYTEAIRLNTRSYRAFWNRGNLHSDQGDQHKALADLNEAIRLHPRDPKLINDRGSAYMLMGDYSKALDDLNEAIRLDPKDPVTLYNRANLFLRQKDYKGAIAEGLRALRSNPRTPIERVSRIHAFAVVGSAYAEEGDYRKAVVSLKEAVRQDPNNPYCHNEIAWRLATCPAPTFRDGQKALQHATKACELSHWKEPRHIDTLAAAEAEVGDFKAAVKWEENYLQSPNVTKKDITEAKKRLALSQNSKPYRTEPNSSLPEARSN